MTSSSHPQSAVQIGDWVLDADLNQLSGPESIVRLEPRAVAVLGELAEHAGQVRTRDELLDAVWGDAFVGEAALTHCIWELRKAFGDDAKNPSFIQTVPRRGYRLVAPVAPVARAPSVVAKTLVAWTAGDLAFTTSSDLAALRAQYEGEGVVADVAPDTSAPACALALFERPTQALRFALALQASTFEQADEEAGAFSVGVHLGEITVRDQSAAADDGESGAVTGTSVAGAAVSVVLALCASAHARQILTSRGVFDIGRAAAEAIAPEQADLRWSAHGDYGLVGHGEPFEVFEVGARGLAPLEAPAGAAGLRPVGGERTVLGWRPAPGQAVPQRPHWQLLHKLGEGGFGEVWLTEHAKTGDKRVFKFCVEVDRLRSLQREVTLFRLLKESLGARPDITRILDWNFDDAPYFLELEYVEGGSFSDWAVSQGGLETVPLATRLEIVAQAGEALAAAHSIGVLHKDVKPGNILIGPGRDAQPRARLTDFGIGRLTDPGQLADAKITRLGLTETNLPETPDSNSGTRLYIAPELLEGRMASIQSDIYSLGVVLYQAVVGRFDRAMGPGWRRQVDDSLLREDIAQCVDLAPEHRPQSARGVAERLRSLEARREQIAEEQRRQRAEEATRLALARAQRRRKLLAGVAGVSLVVAAVVAVLTLLALDARDRAKQSRERAERLVTFMLGDLRGTLEQVGRLDAMERTNEEVLRYFDSLGVDDMGDEALSRRAAALRQIGVVRLNQGELAAAAEAFAVSLESAERLVARDPANGPWQAELADSHFYVGEVLRQHGDLVGTRAAFSAHRDGYERLVAQDPSQRHWRLELAYGHSNLGLVLDGLGEAEAALEHMRARLAILEDLVRESPDDRDLRLGLASSHHFLGQTREGRGDLAGALEHYQQDHAILRELASATPEDTRLQDRLATSAGYVGLANWKRGDAAAARPFYETEAEVFARLAVLDPDNARWQSNHAIALSKVGETLQAAGDVDRALEHFRRARDLFARLVERNPAVTTWQHRLADRQRAIAGALLARGDTAAALVQANAVRRRVRARLDQEGGNASARAQLSGIEILRGEVLARSGDAAAARDAWEAALALIEPLAREADTLHLLDPWARAQIALGQHASAQPILDRLRAKGYRAPDFVAFCRQFGVEI